MVIKMQTIEQHIQHDKEILDDPQLNPAARTLQGRIT